MELSEIYLKQLKNVLDIHGLRRQTLLKFGTLPSYFLRMWGHLGTQRCLGYLLSGIQIRCGGRIKTTDFGSSFVEEGANWIHGACLSNSAFLFGNQHKLIPSPPSIFSRDNGLYYTTNGTVIKTTLSTEAYEFFKELEKKTAKLKVVKQNLSNFLKEEFSRFKEGTDEADKELVDRLLNFYLNYVAMHGGDDPEKMSSWGYGRYDELPGGDVRLPNGYKTFVDTIASNLPKDKILLNHDVVNILWDRNPNVVQCSNGEKFEADVVLLTMPLGVLKQQNGLFTPALPEEKMQLIDRMGFGKVCKIFLEYKSPFWQPGSLNVINLTWSDEEVDALEGSSGYFVTKLFAFQEVPNNPNVLFCWLGGSQCAVVESQPEVVLKKAVTNVLRSFLGNPTIPAPDNVLVTKWCSSPWTRGSYSYLTVDCEEDDAVKLAEPVVQNGLVKILFSGEATLQGFFSTVHGARSAGLRDAERILKMFAKIEP